MIGENIKKLRTEKKLTQKDLADRLYVTPQAVSRWENGEVEPSLSVIKKMAEIFNVTCDNLMDSVFEPSEEEKKTEYVYSEPVRPVLGVCEKCNKPIYDGNDVDFIYYLYFAFLSRYALRTTDNNSVDKFVAHFSGKFRRVEIFLNITDKIVSCIASSLCFCKLLFNTFDFFSDRFLFRQYFSIKPIQISSGIFPLTLSS